MSARTQKWLIRAGLPALGLLVFVYTLHLTFPYEKFLRKYVISSSDKVTIKYDTVDPCWVPWCAKLKGADISWKGGGAKVDEIVFDVSLTGLIFSGGKNINIDVDMVLGDGEIDGEVRFARGKRLEINAMTDRLETTSVPRIEKLVGLPLAGPLDADIRLRFPITKNRVQTDKPSGTVSLSCPGCVLGDGVDTVDLSSGKGERVSLMGSGGELEVPPLKLGDFKGSIRIRSGKIEFEEFGSKSEHGSLFVEGTIEMAKKTKNWKVDQCWRFKISEAVRDITVTNAEGEEEPVGRRFFDSINAYPKQNDGTTHLKWFGRMGNRRARKAKLPDSPCELGPRKRKNVYRPPTTRNPRREKDKSSSSSSSGQASSQADNEEKNQKSEQAGSSQATVRDGDAGRDDQPRSGEGRGSDFARPPGDEDPRFDDRDDGYIDEEGAGELPPEELPPEGEEEFPSDDVVNVE